jgi:hypothetical protein
LAYTYGADFPGSSLLGVRDSETERIRTITRPGQPATVAKPMRRDEREWRLLGHFTPEIERARSYLYAFHRQWYINIAAYLGAQGVQAESIAKILRVNLKKPQHRVYHQSNLVGGSVRRLVGYLARSNPDIDFVPSDMEDFFQVDYAREAKDWLDWQHAYDGWKKKKLEILNWAVTTGMGVSSAEFDYKGGPRGVAVDDDGEIVTDKDGKPLVGDNGKPLSYSTGIAHTRVVPPFHYVYGISARSDEELNWNGEDSWLSFRYLESICEERNIIDKYRLAPEPQFTNLAGLYERQAMQTLGPQGTYTGASPESNELGCRITRIFIAPYYLDENSYGKEIFEKGAFVMFAQGKTIGGIKPNPFMDLAGTNPRSDWNPYTIWPCYSVAGRMIPQGLPDNLLPLQEALNFVFSRLRESQRLMGQPKWFIPRGSINQKIDAEAGQTITFNPGVGPPQPHSPTPMPAYIMQMISVIEEHMEKVSSQPPMMQGRAQGQVRSGLGVQLLQEQALTEFTPLIEILDYCNARHARQLLLREIQFADAARAIPRREGSGQWKQALFYAKHMNPEFMVRIVPGTSMPQSKALVMSELDRMVAWGRLMPQVNPQHADVIDRVMKYEIPTFSPDNTEAAMSQQREENWLMFENPAYEPLTLSHYNHRVHVNEIIRFMDTARFRDRISKEREKFNGISPTLARFETHLGKHYGHLQAIAMGMVLPQVIPPFDDLQVEAAGVGQQQAAGPGGQTRPPPGGGGTGAGAGAGGGGGGGPGLIGGTTGAQAMTNRGMSIGTDQMANEAPRLPGYQGIKNLREINLLPQQPAMQGFSGGA